MKTLKDHTILYDDSCPMCHVYTKAFVKTGMLDQNGRQPYQQLTKEIEPSIDCARAVNEIALINNKTGKVEYGVKSLFLILQNSFPVLKRLFSSSTFFWAADKAYKFVSYNRRVIIPSRPQRHSFFSEPSLHKGYRVFYLLFTWFLTAFMLYRYTSHLVLLIPPASFYREFLICGGQVFWQALIIQKLAPGKTWDYLGNMMTISFAGGILLSIVRLFSMPFDIQQPYFFAFAFGVVAFLMFLEHIRRTRILQISWLMTVSWVLYRIILLFVIL